MIIVLKGADFSANNIGKIEIPRDLTEKQKQMLANYSKNLSYEQKMAFGTFMNTIDDNGITPKIKVLCMPILAGDKSEAFVNLVKSGYGKEIDLGASEHYGMLNDGIGNLETETSISEGLTLPSAAGIKLGDMHIICAADTEYGTYSSEVRACFSYYSPSAMMYFSHSATKHTSFLSRFSIGSTNFDAIYGENSFNVSCKGKTMYGLTACNGKLNTVGNEGSSQTVTLVEGHDAEMNVGLEATGVYNASNKVGLASPHWVISIGEGLILDEVDVFRNAMSALLRAFGKEA